MIGFSLRTGLDFKLAGVEMSIERIQPDGQILLQRNSDGHLIISNEPALLQAYTEGQMVVDQKMRNGKAIPEKALYGRPLDDLPKHVQDELRRRIRYIKWLNEKNIFVFVPEFLDPLIAEAAIEFCDTSPPCSRTLQRWYQRYKLYEDFRALVPRYDRRGSRDLRQEERLLELVAESLEEAFKVSPAANMISIEARLANKLKNENHHRLREDQLNQPSRRTLYRIFGKLEVYEKFVLRDGKAAADRLFRITKAGPKVDYILERVEVDHTPLDLFILDEKTWLPLGRPTLTVIIDCYSRMPLGYYLSFGGTSTTAVMGVVRHAILPKTPCTPDIPGVTVLHAWPCFGLFALIVMDNGPEFHSNDLESVANDLMIELLYCPKRAPRFKARIERYLKTINYSLCHQLPGTSLASFVERGDYDPLKHVLLTFGEFKHALEKWFLDIYAQTKHRGIGTTPWAKWHEGLQRKTPELPASLDILKKRIGRVTERKLRHDGIWRDSIRYASEALLPIMNKWGEGVSVRVVYDEEDLGIINVWPPEQETPITVPAVNQEYAKGLTSWQNKSIRQILREQGKDAEDLPALMAARAELSAAFEELANSRKQGSRKKAARAHGKTSETPNRTFYAKSNSAPAPKVQKPKNSEASHSIPTQLPFFSKDLLNLNLEI